MCLAALIGIVRVHRLPTCMDTACATPASCWYMHRSKMPKGLRFHVLAATTWVVRNIPGKARHYIHIQ